MKDALAETMTALRDTFGRHRIDADKTAAIIAEGEAIEAAILEILDAYRSAGIDSDPPSVRLLQEALRDAVRRAYAQRER